MHGTLGGNEVPNDVDIDMSDVEAAFGNFPSEVLDGSYVDTDEDSTDVVEQPEAVGEDDSDAVEVDDNPWASWSDDDTANVQKILSDYGAQSVEELRSMVMRQADYTRKTQELAADRQRFSAYEILDRHIQANPEDTLEKLAAAFELEWTIGGELGQVPDSMDDPDELDPVAMAREIRELKRQLRQVSQTQETFTERDRVSAIEAEIEAVKSKYEVPDLDVKELLSFAVENGGLPLDMAYRAMNFGKAQQPAKPKPKPVAERGTVRSPRREVRGSTNMLDVDEAFSEAVRELGFNFD
jgi:hypothetical protein